MLHRLTLPTGVTNGSESMAAVLRSVHVANRDDSGIALILANHRGEIAFFIDCSMAFRAVLLVHLLDAFPGAKLDRVDDKLFESAKLLRSAGVLLQPQLAESKQVF